MAHLAQIREALTFDDVLLQPGHSLVMPGDVSNPDIVDTQRRSRESFESGVLEFVTFSR